MKLTAATLGSAAFCGASSAALCAAGAGVAALVGLPFFGAGAVGAAIGISAAFGGTLAALTLRKSFSPPADTSDKFGLGREGIQKSLPHPVRDGASMVLAEKQMWDSLDAAAAAPTTREAAKLGAEGMARLGSIFGHGATRTTCLVLGVAAGASAAGPLGGVLGFLGGFAVSYALDGPGHWVGEQAGRAVGAAAGVAARAAA